MIDKLIKYLENERQKLTEDISDAIEGTDAVLVEIKAHPLLIMIAEELDVDAGDIMIDHVDGNIDSEDGDVSAIYLHVGEDNYAFAVYDDDTADEVARDSVRNYLVDSGFEFFKQLYSEGHLDDFLDENYLQDYLHQHLVEYYHDQFYYDRDNMIRLALDYGVLSYDDLGYDIDDPNFDGDDIDFVTIEVDEYTIAENLAQYVVDNVGDTLEELEDFLDKETIAKAIYDNLEDSFDMDGYIESAMSYDGREHHLASYDGNEIEIGEYNGKYYYMYRI